MEDTSRRRFRVARLALLDTSIRADTAERAAQRRALEAMVRTPGKFHGFGDRLLATYLHGAHLHDPVLVGRIRGMTERLERGVFIRQSRIVRKDGTDLLLTLCCPLLIACGEHDALTPMSDHTEMAELATHATLIAIPNSRHMTSIENPDAVTVALRQWLTP